MSMESFEDCNPEKKRKVLIVFDDIANMEANKNGAL